MAEMSKAYTPEFMGDPNPREKILKLARKITDCVDHKILGVTVNDPEYWSHQGSKENPSLYVTDVRSRFCGIHEYDKEAA